MLKREWGSESNGTLPHLFIPSKTATLVPAFAVEDLPLGRTRDDDVYKQLCRKVICIFYHYKPMEGL